MRSCEVDPISLQERDNASYLYLEQGVLRHLGIVLIVAVPHSLRASLDVDLVRGDDFFQIATERLFLGIDGHVQKVDAVLEGRGQYLAPHLPAVTDAHIAGPHRRRKVFVETSRAAVHEVLVAAQTDD